MNFMMAGVVPDQKTRGWRGFAARLEERFENALRPSALDVFAGR